MREMDLSRSFLVWLGAQEMVIDEKWQTSRIA
jgi:hypothetical protein